MKKIFLSLFISILGVSTSFSQFSTGSNPFTNGNVGIGGQNNTTTTKLYLQSDANWSLISTLNTYNNFSGGFKLLNSGGGTFDAPSISLFNNQNQQIFYTGGAQSGSGLNKIKIPGVYNFEATNIGQYGNGAGGVEFINHSGSDNSYGVRLLANSDEFSGLQIKTANPASSYNGLNFIRNFALGTDGRVFIGSSSIPTGNHKLSVDGNINLTSGDKKLNVSGVYNFEQTNIGQYGNGAGGVEFINHSGSDNSYGVRLIANSDEFSGLQIKTANPVASYGQLSYTTKMKIGLDGKVSIGATIPTTTTFSDYKLSVDGKIVAKEIQVQTGSWADYVFNKDYKLKSLSEVEAYISANKHLPEIPSESEVIENGVNVTEMQKLQMQKIEELTLYIIDQNKKIEKLQTQVSNLINK